MGVKRGWGDAVATDVDGVRYILATDGATLFVVRPNLGGISRCEESWIRAVLAGPVDHVAASYVVEDPPRKVKRSRRRTATVKDTKVRAPDVQDGGKNDPTQANAVQLEF